MTSQIFANIYLNEFDRYIRHAIKPLAYVRYGDDFVLFFNAENEGRSAQDVATKWLNENLYLQVHKHNNIIMPAKYGLHFLGHIIYPNAPLSVDRNTIEKVKRGISYKNAASYRAMALPRRFVKRMPWLLAENNGASPNVDDEG